jgi:hypothetical protein
MKYTFLLNAFWMLGGATILLIVAKNGLPYLADKLGDWLFFLPKVKEWLKSGKNAEEAKGILDKIDEKLDEDIDRAVKE